jgi:hypothetical protein
VPVPVPENRKPMSMCVGFSASLDAGDDESRLTPRMRWGRLLCTAALIRAQKPTRALAGAGRRSQAITSCWDRAPSGDRGSGDFCHFSERDSGYWISTEFGLFNALSCRLVQKIVVWIGKASGPALSKGGRLGEAARGSPGDRQGGRGSRTFF